MAQVAERSVASTTVNAGVYHVLPTSETTWNSLINLWRFEGIRGLYRGFLPGLFGVSHGAIQFMLYEEMRNAYNQHYRERSVNAKLTALEYLTFASLSKLMAAVLTYPYQVLRSRLQDQHRNYRGFTHVIEELWRGEGFFGFYKGLIPNLLRVTPACAITFVIYEYTVDFLRTRAWVFDPLPQVDYQWFTDLIIAPDIGSSSSLVGGKPPPLEGLQHYKNVIDEGNRLREDLRSELARVRKEASIARAQLSSSHAQAFMTDDQSVTSTPRTRNSSRQKPYNRGDAFTRTSSEDCISDTESISQLRSQLERYTDWCNSLNQELIHLRESLRDSTEKELQQTQKLEILRKKVSDLVEHVCELESRRNKQSFQLAKLVLNFRWLGELAQLMNLTLPDNFATLIVEDSQFCVDTMNTLPRKKSRSSQISTVNTNVPSEQKVDSTKWTVDLDTCVSDRPDVDMDTELSGQDGLIESRAPSAICSPTARSVDFFFSDSDLSSSGRTTPVQLSAQPSTVLDTPVSLTSISESLSEKSVGNKRKRTCLSKSPNIVHTQSPAVPEQETGSFKTPLARPSRSRLTSSSDSVGETPLKHHSDVHALGMKTNSGKYSNAIVVRVTFSFRSS
ncbi:unnamed protein product [Echinostoma caproni]|uniref:Mitochondrial carrier domain-containing protein n=1 Tax=Echinostoma caproni TaxID=27848 RepID=A0A183AUH1_9TREM|nr:unnamed protein product [Echinostoma caproni]